MCVEAHVNAEKASIHVMNEFESHLACVNEQLLLSELLTTFKLFRGTPQSSELTSSLATRHPILRPANTTCSHGNAPLGPSARATARYTGTEGRVGWSEKEEVKGGHAESTVQGTIMMAREHKQTAWVFHRTVPF